MKNPITVIRQRRASAATSPDAESRDAELEARRAEDEAAWIQDQAEWAARDAEHALLGEKRIACTGCDCDLYVKTEAEYPYYCGNTWCANGYVPKPAAHTI
jgi:hypothetical protein